MTNYLLIASIVIILSIFTSKLSQKIGIPGLLLFIGLGLLFGSDGLVQINFDNYKFAEETCSVALIFIMFYGGFGTRWKTAKPVAKKGSFVIFIRSIDYSFFGWTILLLYNTN